MAKTSRRTNKAEEAASDAVRLEVRPTRAQKALVDEAANTLGQTVSSFVLSTILARAHEVLLSQVRVLSDRDRDTLMSALEDPRPNAALVRAFRRRHRPRRG